jgi:3-oxoacyl-[acyl-carrier protein] reductase
LNTIVTGCASGIGKELAEELTRRGHPVLATDVDAAALTRVAEERGWREPAVLIQPHDVRDWDSWQRVVARAVSTWGTLDAHFNVAGVIRPESAGSMTPANITLQIDVNTKGVIFGTQAAAEVMLRQKSGHIVNVASMAALAPVPGIAVYAASKFAVRGFSLAVAQELHEHGIAVSVVCPDAVATPMVDYQVDFPSAALTFSGRRMLTAKEVVKVIVDTVLVRRPEEVAFPWHRAIQARIATLISPSLRRRFSRSLRSRGIENQRTLMERRRP